MLDLKKSLQACGYKGPCENEHFLQWAIRTGACSQYFLDLLAWLEQQLLIVNSTLQVRNNITRLFNMMRKSFLMLPSYGSEAARNPKEFRLQTLKVLARQLELRKKPEHSINMGESPRRDNEKAASLNNMTITLNMEKISTYGDWNQRLVRCNKKQFLEVYE